MTTEQAKSMLPFMQAYAEGKTIQFRVHINDEWRDIKELVLNGFTGEYRIKPQQKYRPFKNQEECWNEMLKHQPFGWIKHKETEDYSNILRICKISGITEMFMSGYSCTFPKLFDEFIFIDGTPFGIKEEQ